MIGNDIVDLSFISNTSNWRRKGFLDKVFTDSEQQIIFSSKDQDQTVWRYWSMKEAAYKAHVQRYNSRFFNPKALKCEQITRVKGEVMINNSIYVTKTEYSDQFIFTTAATKDNIQVSSKVVKVNYEAYKFQSRLLRDRVLKHISKTRNIERSDLRIHKNNIGVPMVFKDTQQLQIPLSLTHCGTFLAYSIIDC